MQPATDCKPGHAEGDTALCQKSVLPDSRTGLKHQTDTGLKCPAASQECLLAAVFIRRCGQSVAAAVGESHRKKIIRICNFTCLSPISHLSALPAAIVESES